MQNGRERKLYRSEHWNYGGKNWRLSRSKIDLFLECPRCFYLDNKLGVPRPAPFPMNLNTAVDVLLKKEFDFYRERQEAHPLMKEYGIDAVPFMHPELEVWRDNFKGIEFFDEKLGFTVSGAVDDLWVTKDGEIIVVDYKSTSKDKKIDALDEDWHIGYKRQIEVYQWLLRQNGFKVSDTAYFVYANASKDEDMFDNKLVFELTVIPYSGKDNWIYPVLTQIKEVLEDPRVPKPHPDCAYCKYREAAGRALHKQIKGI